MIRDLRDPTAVGEMYLKYRKGGVDKADLVNLPVPAYSATESTVTETVETYRLEMRMLAAQGDVHARDMCDEHGWAYDTGTIESPDVSAPRATLRVPGDLMTAERVDALPQKQCPKMAPHDRHAWEDVPQPGVRASVVMYVCDGLPIEYR